MARYSEADKNAQMIKSIQRINTTTQSTDTGAGGGGSHALLNHDVTISAVDTTKSFVIIQSHGERGYWWQYNTGGNDTQMRFDTQTVGGYLINSTTLRIRHGQSHNYGTPGNTVNVQVVEYY